jgi:hypothetical protein
MAQSIQPGRFGHSSKPDDAWLAKQGREPVLEPELPIIDTHHHLWDGRRHRMVGKKDRRPDFHVIPSQ